MKKKSYIFFICFLISYSSSWAQTFVNPAFLRAVNSKTRTIEGIPGDNYFQNHSDYQMDVSFDPRNGRLEGRAKIMYYNTSPDTLRRLVFRLYHNFLKKGAIRDQSINEEAISDGVILSELKINGRDFTERINQLIRVRSTNMYLTLTEPLIPFSSSLIELSWSTEIPSEDVHRFGRYGEGNFFVAYWYPQIAVYDDIDGWDELFYNETQEFYNDFNSYDVKISVPGDYMVWATGNWLNSKDILSKTTYNNLTEASLSDETISIISNSDLKDKSWRLNRKKKTYHFRMDSVPDFAFGVSDSYLWDAASVIVDSASKRRVTVNAVYPEGAKYFNEVAQIGARAIRHFSFSSYGVAYPYPGVTVYKGKGGMEFPMIVNNGDQFFHNSTVFITMHELAHAYFPFFTGINERKYAWIDEGLTTFLPMETEIALESNSYSISKVINRYEMLAGTDQDIPFGIPSYYTRDIAYYYHAYMRSSMAFHMLEEYIGRDAFRLAIQDFVNIWKYKHPTPNDLFNVIKKHSGKEIDWFIDQWFYEQGWPDLAIDEVSLTEDTLNIDILKKGNFAVPVSIKLEFEDSASETIRYGAEVWKMKEKLVIRHKIDKKLVSIKLNEETIPDTDRSNNYYIFHLD